MKFFDSIKKIFELILFFIFFCHVGSLPSITFWENIHQYGVKSSNLFMNILIHEQTMPFNDLVAFCVESILDLLKSQTCLW